MTFQPSLAGLEPEQDGRAAQPTGLSYVGDYIDVDEEQGLLHRIDVENAAEWLPDLSRRVQHYGYRYDYKARTISRDMWLGPLPEWLASLGERLVRHHHIERSPEQVIVNEYLPGQGIAPHIDCLPCFGPSVVTLSLGSACVMDFEHAQTGRKYDLLLEARSLSVFTGDARYAWKHGIAKRQKDRTSSGAFDRRRRVSLTFRTVIERAQAPE